MSAPAIERIDVHAVRVPRHAENRVSHAYGTTPDAHYVLVEVAAGGLVGVGEAPTEIWWTGEDAASVRVAIEQHLRPALVGRPLGIRSAIAAMDGALFGHPYAKAAIQMALWDLLGKQAGLPLYRLLGGDAPAPTPAKYGIGYGDPGFVREQVARGRELGFGFFKLKVGQELSSDLARAGAACAELRAGESLGVDANGGWSTAVAIRALAPLTELGIAFLEQPVARDLPHELADVTRRSSIPVMAHEALTTVREAATLAELRVAHLWALTPSMHGGVAQTLDMLALARAHGLPCLFGSTFELGVATAHMLHLGAAFEEFRSCPVPSDVAGPLYVERDVITVPITVRDGLAAVPDGPGLGVELDRELLRAFAA